MTSAPAAPAAVARPEYYIVKEEAYEYVVRFGPEREQTLLARAEDRAQVWDAILTDLRAVVYEAAPGLLLERALGAPSRQFGGFVPRPAPRQLFSEPEMPKAVQADDPAADFCSKHQQRKHKNGKNRRGDQVYICEECRKENVGKPRGGARVNLPRDWHPRKPNGVASHRKGQKAGTHPGSHRSRHPASVATPRRPAPADPEAPVCQKHGVRKRRDGKDQTGKQKWRCNLCSRENTGKLRGGAEVKPAGDSWAKARAVHVAMTVSKNPKCKTCKERLRVSGRHRRADGGESVYYHCINECADTGHSTPGKGDRLPNNFEDVLPIVRDVIARLNGHHPQDREDIVQQVSQDLWSGVLKMKDLKDRERMRGYIRAQTRHSQDKYERPPLDAPLKEGEGGGLTFADTREAPDDSNPLSMLEAREAVEERMRDEEGKRAKPGEADEDEADAAA